MKLSFGKIWALTLLVGLVALFAAASYSSETVENTVRLEDAPGVFNDYTYAPANKPLQKVFSRDSITTAGNTTVTVPWVLASPYQYQYYVRLRKIGITPNIKIVLQETNSTNSTIWSPIDSVSCSGADSTKVHFRLRGTTVYGAKHRLLFVKTGATLVERDIELNVKPTN